MSSLPQAEASRRNGALSRGPVTSEGKSRSSRNSVKHGMYSRTVVLGNESQDAFEQLLNTYVAELQPVGGRELDLVHDIVVARWRLNRVITLETATLDHEMDVQRPILDRQTEQLDEPTRASLAFASLANHSRGLALLNRWEARLLRTIHRAGEALDRLQEKRQKCKNEPS